MRCASASRERMILVSVAHREGVHLLRFKAADHFAGRPEASSHHCDGMPGRMLAPATTVAIMAPAMPAMTGVASPVHVVVHIAAASAVSHTAHALSHSEDIVTMLYEMRACLRCQRLWWSTLRLTWAGSA